MLRLLCLTLLCAAPIPAQGPQPPVPPPAADTVPAPSLGNATCPIMGKPVSKSLFVDTDLGRIYVCCKPCYRKVLADVPAAHKTAYPVVRDLANTVCPISGKPIAEHAVAVTLQGVRFKVCGPACVAPAQKDAQAVLAKVSAAADRSPRTPKPPPAQEGRR